MKRHLTEWEYVNDLHMIYSTRSQSKIIDRAHRWLLFSFNSLKETYVLWYKIYLPLRSKYFWILNLWKLLVPSIFLPKKAMAPHSSTLAWKIPWMEEPGRLQSMGSLRVGHDWATSLSLFTFMHWRRKWQPTPVFLPGESQGLWSLAGCRLWGLTGSNTTEVT